MQQQLIEIPQIVLNLVNAVIRDVPGLTFIKEVKFKNKEYAIKHKDKEIKINLEAHVKYKHKKSPEADGEGDWMHQDDCNWWPII